MRRSITVDPALTGKIDMAPSCAGQQTEIRLVLLGPAYGSGQSQTLCDLERRLTAGINSASTGLLVDFGGTTYVGCGLLNVLLRCNERAKHMNRRVVFCGLMPLPRQVLVITRLESLWEVFETRQKAMEAARQRSMLG